MNILLLRIPTQFVNLSLKSYKTNYRNYTLLCYICILLGIL